MMCRHCHCKPANRPKGMCWTCYRDLAARCRYAALSKFGIRGIADFNGDAPLSAPTTEIPGTPGKVAVLIERAKHGKSLWHPLDVIGLPSEEMTALARCINGHELTEWNRLKYLDKHNGCRKCKLSQQAQRRRLRKGVVA